MSPNDAPAAGRKTYLDWLRGVGVVLMVQGHVIDAWTLDLDRGRAAYQWVIFVGGLAGTPIFLLLAGVALALAAGKRLRSGRSETEVAALARKRGWQVLGLAFAFRLQAWLISGGPPQTMLKVDILNVMGLAMIAAAALWRAGHTPLLRAAWLAAGAVGIAMLTPLVRASTTLGVLPDFLERYLRPGPGGDAFSLFPWAGFLLAGGVVGLWIDAASTRRRERNAVLWLGAAGAGLAMTGYAASFLPPVYSQTNFWTSSPTFFLVRLGVVVTLVPLAYAWSALWVRSPLAEFGRSSLFVYWIHVEMAYGAFSSALRRALPFEGAYVGFLLLTLLLFGLVRLKARLVGWWKDRETAIRRCNSLRVRWIGATSKRTSR